MTLNRERIEALVMCVQSAFLDSPALRLPLAQAARRFGIDSKTCQAILEALVDANVLTLTTGAYARLFPHREAGVLRGRAHAA